MLKRLATGDCVRCVHPPTVIHSVTSSLQTQHPQALFLISGDFNHASLSSTLPTFIQSVRLHAQLSQITAIVRLCYSVRQLQLSVYTCGEKIRLLAEACHTRVRYVALYPFQLAVIKSPPADPLRHRQQQTLPRHTRKMAYEERGEATSLYILYMVYTVTCSQVRQGRQCLT